MTAEELEAIRERNSGMKAHDHDLRCKDHHICDCWREMSADFFVLLAEVDRLRKAD